MQFTSQKVAQDFRNLQNPNLDIRQQANIDLLQFESSSQAWLISKELLNFQYDQNLHFLGAQVLYLKIKNDYAFLQEGEIDEIKLFIFDNINGGLDKFSPQTFKQLCASASVIGLKMIQNNWKNFIGDMITLANTSNQNLFAALEILSSLCRELKNIDVQLQLVKEIRATLAHSTDIITEFLAKIIQDSSHSTDIVNKALECVNTWAQIRAFEVLQYPHLLDALLKAIDSEQTVEGSIEALCEGLKNSVYADILSTTRIEYSFGVIPPEIKDGLRKIIKFLYDLHLIQKELNLSPFCVYLCELASHVGRYFGIMILENTEYSKALLQFLLMCTSHKDRKTSANTFEFWSTFALDITKKEMLSFTKNTNFDFIVEAYVELFKAITEKCRLKTLKIITLKEAMKSKIINVDTEQEEDFSEDDLVEDFDRKDLSIREYRAQAKDAFESCYVVLSGLKGEDGVNALFTLMISPLTKQYITKNNINLEDGESKADYILTCEALVFGVRCLMEIVEILKPNPYLIEMIKNVIVLPREDLIVRGVLKLIYDCMQQLKYMPEYADQIFEYCMSDMTNPNLVVASTDCFQVIAEVLGDKININTLEKTVELMDQAIYAIEDAKRSAQCIGSIFHIGRFLVNHDVKVKYLQRALKSIQEKFQIFRESLDKSHGKILNEASVKADALKLFVIFENVLQGFEFEYSDNKAKSGKIIEETLLPFILHSMNDICIYLELFHQIKDFVVTFSLLIKMAVKICGMKLENFYEKILYTSLKVFEVDPLKNMSLLDTVSTLIVFFENSTKQKEWLFSNFTQFNTFMIQTLIKGEEQKPDLFLKWVDILGKVLIMYREYFITLKEVSQIIDLLIRVFYEFSEIKLLRKIIWFFANFIANKISIQSPAVIHQLPKLLAFALIKLPDTDVQRIKMLSRVVATVLLTLEEQEAFIIELFFTVFNMDRFSEIEGYHKELFLKSLFLYRSEEKMVCSLMQNFGRFVTDPSAYKDSIMFIQVKIFEKQQEIANSYRAI